MYVCNVINRKGMCYVVLVISYLGGIEFIRGGCGRGGIGERTG